MTALGSGKIWILVADWSRLAGREPNADHVTRKIGPLYFNALTPKEDTCCTNKSLKRFVSRSEEVEHRLLPPFNAAWYDTLQIIHTYLQVNRTKFWFWWSGGKIYKEEEALYLNVRSLGNLSCVKLSSLPSKRF